MHGNRDYRERLCAWLRANGVDPADVPADSTIEETGDTLSLDVVVRDAGGAVIVATNSVLRTRITVPLIVPWCQ